MNAINLTNVRQTRFDPLVRPFPGQGGNPIAEGGRHSGAARLMLVFVPSFNAEPKKCGVFGTNAGGRPPSGHDTLTNPNARRLETPRFLMALASRNCAQLCVDSSDCYLAVG